MRAGLGWDLLVSLGAVAFGCGSCVVRNPDWVALTSRLGADRIAVVRKHQAEVADQRYQHPEAWRSYWDGLSDAEREFLHRPMTQKLLRTEEFLYRPTPFKSLRSHAIDSLTLFRAFPKGDTRAGEIEPFDGDEWNVSLDVLGLDWMFWDMVRDGVGQHRRDEVVLWNLVPRAVGVALSGGISSVPAGEKNVPLAIASAGLVVDYDLFALEGGHVWGYSWDSSLNSSQNDQDAWYFGVRFDAVQVSRFGKALAESAGYWFKSWY